MTFEEAIRKILRVYWNKPDEFSKMTSFQSTKYSKSYFDGVEKEMLSVKDQSKNSKELKKEKNNAKS